MRKLHKELISDIVKSLNEANSEIQSLFFKKDFQTLNVLLTDCLENALQVCDFINQLENTEPETVLHLKEYCDVISCIINQIDNSYELIKKLKKQIIKIENSVKNDLIINKIEVVFFPYKASMWDSFESIWLAAKDDPQCEAYVVPIPYYEKNSDGSFGKLHYEGDLYPDYVPVTDWQQYDIEARRPDAVFIHNPYDDMNYVTSVHTNYYSSVLKKYTDCLVYVDYGIPYRVHSNPQKAFTAEIADEINILPSQINCNLTVFYSEKTLESGRLALLFSNVTKGLFNKREINERTVALGSAKFDKILNAKKENYPLCDSWQNIVNGKKVMLFSTSVSAMLKGNEEFIDRLRHVIKTFKERDDIVLWWRPHPFSESTYTSMRPQLLNEYRKIIENYRRENIGIYDETPDLHRAIVWSDGCYTDESSLMFLYLATGKPFMVRIFDYTHENPIIEDSVDFTPLLSKRIKSMQAAKSSDDGSGYLINWNRFINPRYSNSLERFIHFVLNEDKYPDAEVYRQLKLEMFRDVVVNHDGSAGQKIYSFVKQKTLGVTNI